MVDPFMGSEALVCGRLTRHALRSGYFAIYPDVYVPCGAELCAVSRAKAAWLWSGRLLLIRAGFPPPQTQVPVYDEYGQLVAVLDMGWESIKLAAEYEGDHHRTDRRQFNKDIRRAEALADLGWIDIRVTAEDTEGGVIARVRAAWERRACNEGAISINSPP
jgi:hypothetical protein